VAARLALVVGDATLVMYNFSSGMSLEEMPIFEEIINELLKDPKQLLEMSPDSPASRDLANAPAWFRDTMFFTYLNGYTFCMSVKRLGGQKLLDYAFSKDPPRSTHQILHPEKWHTQRSDPVEVAWPELSGELPGFQKVSEGQLGEIGIKVLLNEKLKNKNAAATAAAGWAGDRFAVYEKNGARMLAWITEWESASDGAKFLSAAALGAGWVAEAAPAQPKRVIVICGKVAEANLAALKEKLAAAKAIYPENKNIDLAALGIKPGEQPEAGIGDLLNNPKMMELANKMLGGGKDGEPNMGELLKNPQTQQMAKDFANKMLQGGSNGKESDFDLGALLNNPQMQDMVKGLLDAGQPAGEVSADGRAYTNAKLGFSIKVPSSLSSWKLDGNPAIPMASVAISSPDGSVAVSVGCQSLPMAITPDLMESALEMGPQMLMSDYKKISGGEIEKNGHKGYELQYEARQEKQKLHALQRVFNQGARLLVLSAVAPAEKWRENEKAILETLGTFALSVPQSENAVEKKK
jgi:hypothetical protein